MKNEKSNSQFEIKEKKTANALFAMELAIPVLCSNRQENYPPISCEAFWQKKKQKKGKNQTNQSISHFFSGQSSNGNT